MFKNYAQFSYMFFEKRGDYSLKLALKPPNIHLSEDLPSTNKAKIPHKNTGASLTKNSYKGKGDTL